MITPATGPTRVDPAGTPINELRAQLGHYGLVDPIDFFPITGGSNNQIIGVRCAEKEYVLKTIVAPHSLATVQHEQQLLRWLATQKLPFAVPAPLPTHNGDRLLQSSNGYHILMPLLAGQKPAWRDPQQIALVGAALAALHSVFARYPHPNNIEGTVNIEDTVAVPYGALEKLTPHIPDPYRLSPGDLGLPNSLENERDLAWWRAELDALHTFVQGAYRKLPWQFIHSDYGHMNTLYHRDSDGARITAVLDFEFAGMDARAMDVASALYFAMRVWENADPLSNADAFCRGYAQQAQLTAGEVAAIPWLIRLRNAASTTWWLGRAIASGVPPHSLERNSLERIDDMRTFVEWLGRHATELCDIVEQYHS